jgi:UDP-glucuronate decarboxylase
MDLAIDVLIFDLYSYGVMDTVKHVGPLKRILVTGGAGFLGLHLCKRLLEMGHDVICVDNLFTSQKVSLRPLLQHEHFEFVRHDVTNPYHAEVDEIYNLACPASPVHYQYNPIKTAKVRSSLILI